MFPRGAKLQTTLILLCSLAAAWLYSLGQASSRPENLLGQGLSFIGHRLVRAEFFLRDAIARAGRKTAPNPQLVYLAIDNDSVKLAGQDLRQEYDLRTADPASRQALDLMSHSWPWPRSIYPLIIERLVSAGAKTVVFDLNFPTETASDPSFKAALDRYKDRVVLGSNFVPSSENGETLALSLALPTETLIPSATPLDDRIGYVNFWPDHDEVVRQAQYSITFEEANGYLAPAADSERYHSLIAAAATKAGFAAQVPRDTAARTIRFTGGPGTYRPHSLFQIFVPEYWERAGTNTGIGNIGGYEGGGFFRDKIVIVGAAGNWQHDEHRTSFGIMPGPELQIQALNALLQGEFIRQLPPSGEMAAIALAGLLTWLLWVFIRLPWLRFATTLALSALWLGAAILLFNHGLIVLAFTPLLVVNLSGVAGLIYDVMLERKEGARIRSTLERYVSHNVVSELLDHPQDYTRTLSGVVKPVTILFSDIRNFTRFSSTTDPHALVSQLNEYFSGMVECVFAHGGTLDKFIGDAVMAVWGNARSRTPEQDATDAVRAALAMRVKLRELNAQWHREGRPLLEIGIALDHGQVVVGNIGSPQRMEFTVIGPAVNMSWRLQELTKKQATDLLVSETVAELVRPSFPTCYITTFTPDPNSPPMAAYQITENARPPLPSPLALASIR